MLTVLIISKEFLTVERKGHFFQLHQRLWWDCNSRENLNVIESTLHSASRRDFLSKNLKKIK